MTDLNQARQAVYARFNVEWGDEPYCFDNETLQGELPATWARCSVRSLPNSQETLGATGNRKFKRKAIAVVEIYTPPGVGRAAADALVITAMNMFEGRSILGTSIKLYEASSAENGLVNDNRWNLSTVQAYFDYEEIK